MLAVSIILGVLCLSLLGVVFWQLARKPQTNSDAAMLLKAEMTEISRSMGVLKDGLQKQPNLKLCRMFCKTLNSAEF
jgi:hypothetical protein